VLEGKADVAAAHGNLADVEQHDRAALALAKKLFGFEHPTHIETVDRIVNILRANGKRAEAEKIRRDELTDVKKRFGDRSSTTARATRSLAGILANSARIGDAIELYRQALVIDEQAFGGASREAALDQLEIGSILITIGKFDEAQTALKSARTIGDDQRNLQLISLALEQMAYLAALRGEPAEGLVHMEALVNTLDKMFAAGSPALVASLAQASIF
jgi:tetratricopeptide (TPR) repeat protein